MTYSVKQLAKISGVSIRTLHFYDEIDLLKPAVRKQNNYRYYGEAELLKLQQILFYRELDFPLNEIRKMMGCNDFDKISTLQSHKKILNGNLNRTKILIKTIDKTISHLQGKIKMRDKEMYEGFDLAKQQEHEQYLLSQGVLTQPEIDHSWEKVKDWKKENWTHFQNEGDTLNKALVQALQQQIPSSDKKVQALIQKHYEWVKCFWTPNKETYVGLANMYLDHPDFRGFYEAYHPGLAEYLVAGMKIFAQLHIKE